MGCHVHYAKGRVQYVYELAFSNKKYNLDYLPAMQIMYKNVCNYSCIILFQKVELQSL